MADTPTPNSPHFMINDFQSYYHPDGISIFVKTDIAISLNIYWTRLRPLTHRVAKIDRGLQANWGAYFCFHGWYELAPCSPGDLVEHVFQFIPWEHMEIRYFVLAGKVAGDWSPSRSPIFNMIRRPLSFKEIIYEEWSS